MSDTFLVYGAVRQVRRDLPSEGGSDNYHAAVGPWLARGDDMSEGMMILASAMRHSVGRPAMGIGGGTLDLWSNRPLPSDMAFDIARWDMASPRLLRTARILSYSRRTAKMEDIQIVDASVTEETEQPVLHMIVQGREVEAVFPKADEPSPVLSGIKRTLLDAYLRSTMDSS